MGKEAKKTKNNTVKNKPETGKPKNIKNNNVKKKPETEKPNFMRKKLRLIIPVIVILCIIGLVLFTLNSDVIDIDESSDEAKAQLIVESGNVQVKSGGGLWASAQNGTLLYQSDSVKTGSNTSASIVLFKTSIIRLDSNTEVTIREIQQAEETSVEIEQNSGRTWNTIKKISGIDDYEVQTPTTIASVRGTSFDVYILANGNITISVGNGTVNVTSYKDGQIIHSIEVPEYLSLTVDPGNLDKIPNPIPYEEDAWILENQQKDDELIKDLKEELYKRIEPFLPELRELLDGNPTDEEIEVLIEGYILGEWSLPADSPDWAKKLFEFA